MKKELAARIVDAVIALDKELGKLDTLIGSIEEEEERRRYGKALSEVFRSQMDILLLIERQYPDLNPDK
jgi:hypothetical protein